ncbi:hypothetical protein MD484_g8292, partial [Candolleomyces efflorescens]
MARNAKKRKRTEDMFPINPLPTPLPNTSPTKVVKIPVRELGGVRPGGRTWAHCTIAEVKVKTGLKDPHQHSVVIPRPTAVGETSTAEQISTLDEYVEFQAAMEMEAAEASSKEKEPRVKRRGSLSALKVEAHRKVLNVRGALKLSKRQISIGAQAAVVAIKFFVDVVFVIPTDTMDFMWLSNPQPSFGDRFCIIDQNGIHTVNLDFCNCDTAQPHFVQLLRYGWYPATVTNPNTAATLSVLKLYQMLSHEGKISAFEFYTALERLSDNTGTSTPKVSEQCCDA